jgi:hypothetical protein
VPFGRVIATNNIALIPFLNVYFSFEGKIHGKRGLAAM